MIHEIIYQLNPKIKRIVDPDLDAYDAEGNPVEYDLAVAQAKLAEYEAAEAAKKQSAQDKLAKLGLTPEDLKMLLG